MDLTDGSQLLSTVFEARIREKRGKSRQNGRYIELIHPQSAQILILVRFISTTSPNQTTYPGIEET